MLKHAVISLVLSSLFFLSVYAEPIDYSIPTNIEDREKQESILMQINEAKDFFRVQEVIIWYRALKILIFRETTPQAVYFARSILAVLQERLPSS